MKKQYVILLLAAMLSFGCINDDVGPSDPPPIPSQSRIAEPIKNYNLTESCYDSQSGILLLNISTNLLGCSYRGGGGDGHYSENWYGCLDPIGLMKIPNGFYDKEQVINNTLKKTRCIQSLREVVDLNWVVGYEESTVIDGLNITNER